MRRFLKTLKDFSIPFLLGLGASLLSILTILSVGIGSFLLAVTLINPINLWWSVSPIETPLYTIGYTQVIEYLEFMQSYYWYSIGLSASLIVFGYSIHIRSLKALYEGIKASPRALLYSPITIYRELVEFRDWLFEKIEYLNGESAKWRRFFNVMKSPYSLLRSFGLSPQLAITLLVGAGATGTAVGVAEVLEERSFSNGDAGIYLAPSNLPNEDLEREMAWRKDNPSDNTLRVILNSTPIEEVSISNVNLGTSFASNGQPSALPSGKTEAILIDGNNTRIEIGKLTFSRNSCKTLNLEAINSNKITIKDNQADGLSIYQTATSTQPNLRISGGNFMSDLLTTEGGTYDRLWIAPLDSMTSSKTKINELILENIVSSGGTCDLKKLDIGELIITFNRIGGDNSLLTKAFTVSTTVAAASFDVSGNLEILMGEVERQPD